MFYNVNIEKILFLDIETVSGKASFNELDDTFKSLWKLKCRQILRDYDAEVEEEQASLLYKQRAAIYAEYGKIVVISVGFLAKEDGKQILRLKSFKGDDEKALLEEFSQLLNKHFFDPNVHYICGHNIKEFDVPYLCRRLVINQMQLPNLLNVVGKKPWEVKYFMDTMELWKFGDYKNYTSLKLLAAVMGIPSPKDDIDGSEVGMVYWLEKDLNRIAVYCEKDVLTVVQLFMKYCLNPVLTSDQIVSVTKD